MQPDIVDRYEMMESDGLKQLRTIFEEMNSEDTVIMISEGCDITFQLDAIYREISLPGSQDGLGSSNVLHH